MTPPDPVPASSTFVVNCALYSLIAFHAYEWLYSFSFEVGRIWSKSWRSIVKWQYLYSRYFCLAAQIINVIFYADIQRRDHVSPSLCHRWFGFQNLAGQSLLLSLNISLIHRLIALYHPRPSIIKFLVILVSLEFINGISFGYLVIQRLETAEACFPLNQPFEILYLLIMHFVVQGTLWGLSLVKLGIKSVPIVSLVLRDASGVFAAMLFLYTALLINNFNRLPNLDIIRTTIYLCTSPIAWTITTSANCHIIKNMELYGPARTESKNSSEMEMTTVDETT